MGYLRALSRLINQNKRIIYSYAHTRNHQPFINHGYVGVLSQFTRPVATQPRKDYAIDEMRYGRQLRQESAKALSKDRISTLDIQARRIGRVSAVQVRYALTEILTSNEQVCEETALTLMRCTGNLLVNYSLEDRRVLADEAWEKLGEIGVVKTTKLYNARLRVMLENEVAFCPHEFFESMGEVKPNRVTYQLLIARYCKTGDMVEAMKLMENITMKSDLVYNHLLSGFLRQGKNSQAADMIQEMSMKGLGPTADTYAIMMQCHAEKGNITAMQKVFATATDAEMVIGSHGLLEAAYRLVRHGHSHLLNAVLEMIPSNITYAESNIFWKNTIYSLTAEGHMNESKVLFDTLLKNTPENKETVAGQYLRTLVSDEKPRAVVWNLYDEFVERELLDNDPTILPVYALRFKRNLNAVEYLKETLERGQVVTIQNFRALFMSCATHRDVPAIYGILEVLSHRPDTRNKLTCAHSFAILPLSRFGQTCEQITSKLEEINYSKEFSTFCVVMDFVRQGEFALAAQFMEGKSLPRVSPHISYSVAYGLDKNPEKWTELTQFFVAMRSSGLDSATFAWSMPVCLKAVLQKIKSLDSSMINISLESFIDQLKDADMAFLSDFKEGVISLVPEGVSQQSKDDLISMFTIENELLNKRYDVMSVEELQVESERGQFDAKKNLLKRYLMELESEKTIIDDDICKKALVLKKELEFENAPFGPVVTAALIKLAYGLNDLDMALKLKKDLDIQYPYYNATTKFSLYLCSLLIKAGRVPDALAELDSHSQRMKDVDEKKTYNPLQRWNTIIKELMKNCADHAKPEEVQLLMAALEKANIFNGQWTVLEHAMKAYIEGGDMVRAVNMIETCVDKYKKAPHYSALIRKLIVCDENVALLQRVVDALQKIKPQRFVLTELMFNYVECGKVVFARKLLECSALNNPESGSLDIRAQLENWVKYKQKHNMETFANISKKSACVDREDVLFYLIKMAVVTNGVESALDVLVTYEEELLKPRPRTLRYLANVCRSKQMPIPFQEPPVIHGDASRQQFPPNHLTDDKRTALLKEINALGSKEALFTFIQSHISSREHIIFIRKHLPIYMDKDSFDDFLVENCDYKTLLQLGHRLPTSRLFSRIATKLVEQKKVGDLLRMYKDNDEMLIFGCPSYVLLGLDEIAPDVSAEVKQMHEQMIIKKKKPPYALIHYHLQKNDLEKASHLFKTYCTDTNLRFFIRSFREEIPKLEKLMPVIRECVSRKELTDVMDNVIKTEFRHGSTASVESFVKLATDNDLQLFDSTRRMLSKQPQDHSAAASSVMNAFPNEPS